MRVLITGATGFLGGALVRACLAAGMDVVAARRPHSPVDRLADVADRVTFHDVSDDGLDAALGTATPCDAIIHAATCYGRNGEAWTAVFEANTRFPLRLLERAVARGVGTFINIDTVLDPQVNAYALSKRQFADWGRLAACHSPALRFVNVRLEHIYGPGDDASKFVTHIIRRCLANAESIPLTEGLQRRDFIHVSDAVAGLRQLLEVGHGGLLPTGWSEFDLGSGEAVRLRDLVELVHRLSASRAGLQFGALPYRANESMESVADTAALRALGWQCRIPLAEGLKQTIDYEKRA